VDAGFLILLAIGCTTFINILVPLPGSAIVTPLVALFTDPHKAVGLTSFLFFLSSIISVCVFRKDIELSYLKILLPFSVMGAIAGAFCIGMVSALLLYLLILGVCTYFLIKKLMKAPVRKQSRFGGQAIGTFSGFLQGTGLAGSDLRNSYLYSRDLTVAQVRGTSMLVGAAVFLAATAVRIGTGQLAIPDLVPLLYLLPFMIIGTLLGRKALHLIDKRYGDRIIIVLMAIVIISLIWRITTVW
jgi:uncharacterized protein